MGKAGNTMDFTLALFWEMPEHTVFRTIVISDNNRFFDPLNIEYFNPQSENLTKLVTKKWLFCHGECLAYQLGQWSLCVCEYGFFSFLIHTLLFFFFNPCLLLFYITTNVGMEWFKRSADFNVLDKSPILQPVGCCPGPLRITRICATASSPGHSFCTRAQIQQEEIVSLALKNMLSATETEGSLFYIS